jgi:hypothetical protein
MTAVELTTYRVLVDRASPVLMGGIRHGMHGVLRVRIRHALARTDSSACCCSSMPWSYIT